MHIYGVVGLMCPYVLGCRRTWIRWWCWICSGGFRQKTFRCCWWTQSRGSRPTSSWPACWCRLCASGPRWSATSSPAPTRTTSPWSSQRSFFSMTSLRRYQLASGRRSNHLLPPYFLRSCLNKDKEEGRQHFIIIFINIKWTNHGRL